MIDEPRRVRGHIDWQGVEAQLRSTRSMLLSSTRPDGRPHSMPTWFWWTEGHVYFITVASTQKARNVERQPWVVAHFGDGDDVLMAEGPATIVSDKTELQRVDDGYRNKYIDPVSGARASISENPADDLYRIDVARIVTWMYGTVAGWTEWHFE